MKLLILLQILIVTFTFSRCKLLYYEEEIKNEEVQNKNQEIVEQCSRDKAGLKKVINTYMTSACKKNFDHSSKSAYIIETTSNGVSLSVFLKFIPKDENQVVISASDPRSEKMFRQTTDCIPEIKKIWDRYRINFNLYARLNETEKIFLAEGEALEIPVALIDREGRGNTSNFFTKDDRYYCQMVLHEIGHYLGLPDEYLDSDCNYRPIAKEEWPYSIMGVTQHKWENLDFHKRHIEQILQPLCE